MLLLSCPEKRVCDEGLAGCNTVVTLHFLKVPSPSRGFFPGQLGSCQPLRFGSAKRDKGSPGGREVLGGGVRGVLELQAFSITTVSVSAVAASHSAGVPRPWYTIVKRWQGQDVRVCAFILKGRLADDETQIFCVDQE